MCEICRIFETKIKAMTEGRFDNHKEAIEELTDEFHLLHEELDKLRKQQSEDLIEATYRFDEIQCLQRELRGVKFRLSALEEKTK